MNLALKVLAFKNNPVAINDVILDGKNTVTIGRTTDNTLALPDTEKFVSRHHATIKLEHDCYYLTDTSLGGVLVINSHGQETRVNNSTIAINHKDILKIGEYEIAVTLANEQHDDLRANLGGFENKANSLMGNNSFLQDDILAQQPYKPTFVSPLENNNNLLNDVYIPPKIISVENKKIPDKLSFDDLELKEDLPNNYSVSNHSSIIPDFSNIDDLLNINEEPPLPPQPQIKNTIATEIKPQVSQANNVNIATEKTVQALPDSVLFDAFLKGAGIKQMQITPEQQQEILERVGQMFRQFVDRTVSVLKARTEFKKQFRIDTTTLAIRDNNPLKFSVSTDESLQRLIENKDSSYLDSVTAINEAFKDIINHQFAMQAGIQASLNAALKSFDPELIEQQFQGVLLQKKPKCWDQYKISYPRIVYDAKDNIFGEEFVNAYEKQMNNVNLL